MTKQQLINLTRRAAKKLGSQAALGREIGCTRDHINKFINGEKNPPARLLAYLGYKEKVTYERI
jgi:biotin operon repressor